MCLKSVKKTKYLGCHNKDISLNQFKLLSEMDV